MTSLDAPRHRLLMITRHFPPMNVSGALRLASFARHLLALEEIYAAWKTMGIKVFHRDVSGYTRHEQAFRLARVLDRVVTPARLGVVVR